MHHRFVLNTLSLLFLWMSCSPAIAQPKAEKRLKIFPIPAIYYAPETNLVFGALASATHRFKRDVLTNRPSNITIGGAYTLNKQTLLYSNFTVFYDEAKWYAFGEAGYYKYSYNFYGVGENEVQEELYGVDYPRIKLNLTHRILPHIYAGLAYQFEDYIIKDTLSGGSFARAEFTGARGSRTSGGGLQLIFDSRDSVLFPGKGFFATATFLNNGISWGGDHNFNKYILDIAYYTRVAPNLIVAVNSFNSFTTGDAPFQQQSLLGGNMKLRGYYQGRYLDKNLMVLQAEARFPIYKRLGAAVFGGAGLLGNEQEFLRAKDVKYAGGFGLRFNVIRTDHLNLRLDYALGPGTSGIYFTIREAF